MSGEYQWALFNGSGEPVRPAMWAGPFPSQSEAEAWLGDEWRELEQAGVAEVTLLCGQEPVYGPMSLSAE
ncbi:MAG: hypothetical protein WBG57_05055 [Ornithinimicrobium sp.]